MASRKQTQGFGGAKGRITPDQAYKSLPRFKDKQTDVYVYAFPWKRVPYWLVIGQATWDILSTKTFRANYVEVGEIAQALMAKHMKMVRRDFMFKPGSPGRPPNPIAEMGARAI